MSGVYGCRIPDICVDRWRICLLIQKAYPLSKKHNFNLVNFLVKSSQGLSYLHECNNDNFKEQAFLLPSRAFYLDNNDYIILPPYLDFKQPQSAYEAFKNG